MLTIEAAERSDVGTDLLTRLAGFTAFLHGNGYGVSAADTVDIVDAAAQTGILNQAILRWNLKSLLCKRFEEWQRFDALFDAYFLPPNKCVFVQRDAAPGTEEVTSGGNDDGAHESPATAKHGEADAAAAAGHGASREENLSSTDFSELNQADQARKVEALMRRLARRLKHLVVRREVRSQRGRRLDLQSTIRQSVSTGGTPLRFAWKTRRRVRPRLVLLLDVSRSMNAYSFFYLRLARALCNELKDVHCFIFHTRITSVAEALRDPDPWRAQERLNVLAVGWGGGTRIGECLQEFNRVQGSRLVHSRTGVIIFSDGYDTGDTALLADALGTLRRRARRMIWLNPLLNQPDFTPVARGMRTAMPYLDLLAPGGDLAAIERVLPQLIESLQ
ncbi:MAG: VWA domain-containing protein [Proteobacteria bacterium]|nr:VWA domain-containing protein [Pseudomonadota bacterium]